MIKNTISNISKKLSKRNSLRLPHPHIMGALWVALLFSSASFAHAQTVSVTGGQISGVVGADPNITVYKGIPYAAPPVGDLRWKKPQPVKPWQGVRRCDTFGAASLQADHQAGTFYWKEFYQDGDPVRSEDCLYLNVWTPTKDETAKLPVIVWIHGGGYMAGFGHEIEFDGTAYARQNVLLVTLNYRLGMCGFLAHPLLTKENGGKGSGNYGFYDQIAAIQWVHDNIQKFGGDPANVTIMGQSAGAGSVQTLVSSPLTKGLFQRAIIQSGGGLGGIISAKSLADAEAQGKQMWEAAGITTLEDMRKYPAEKFQEVLMKYYATLKTFTGLPFDPCVDGELLTAPLNEVALNGEEHDISYLIGFTSEDILPPVMRKAAIDWSLLLENQGRKPAYVYCFSRDLPGEDMPGDQKAGAFGDMKGAFHSAELWYMFGTLDRCWRPMTAEDHALSNRMVKYWTNFARTGNPNGDGVPAWEPCTKGNQHVQELK